MESGDLIAVGIVWLIIIAIAINDIMSRNKKDTQIIVSKGVKLKDLKTHRFKYKIKPIFSTPSDGYQLKYTSINLEIISKTTRLATIPITSDLLVISRNDCCFQDICANFTLIRKRVIPSITRVRAIHNCEVKDSKIFLEGIELHDLKNGEQRFYSIQQFIFNEEMKDAKVHEVKELEITYCSKQTLAPNFVPLVLENFGRPIKSTKKDGTIEEENGLIISPKLDWFEAIIFYSFFFMSTFFTTVAILVFKSSLLNTTSTAIMDLFLSGFFALLFTESLSIIFRDYIKRNYNAKCAPMRVSSGTSSKTWSFIRGFYLFLVFMCALSVSISIPFMINSRKKSGSKTLAEEHEFNAFKNSTFNEICFLLFFLFASLLITLTIWFVVFGMIRYFWRKRRLFNYNLESSNSETKRPEKKSSQEVITPPAVETDSIKTEENTTQAKRKRKSQYSDNTNDESLGKKKRVYKTDSQIKATLTLSSRSHSSKRKKKSKHQKLGLGTKYLEQEMANKEKRNRLTTASVIVRPTKSVGFINPEEFRLSQSSTDVHENK